MDIVGTTGASLQFAAFIFKSLQTVEGVWKGRSSEPIVALERLCDDIQKECGAFVAAHPDDLDGCNIAAQGLSICKALRGTLEKMHPAEKRAKTLARAVFQTMWSKDKLAEQQRNLDSCMQALERLALRRLTEKQASEWLALRQFEDDTGLLLQHIVDHLNTLHGVAQLYKQALQHQNIERILTALAFDGLGHRYGSVHEAEAETFRWVLNLEEEAASDASSKASSEASSEASSDPEEEVQPNNDRESNNDRKHPWFSDKKALLATWLAQGSGIFHVIGKPGSGKSTLMRYIVDEPKTADLLQQWAGGTKLVQASCFFWKPGNLLQRSMMGLIRTLLHGMIQANHGLAKTLFADVWASLGDGAGSSFKLSDRTIKDAWDRLVSGGGSDSVSDYRCCFFIDGLDEFGERRDTIPSLVRELKKMVQGTDGRIKICVSSRAYPEIVNGLGAEETTHRILLQDLTKGDIERFVDSRLQETCDVSPMESSDVRRLREEILRGAEGVFLWVAIVVGMVQSDAWGGASVDDMLATICEAQDQELDGFLHGVISRVQKRHRKKVAVLLKYTVEMGHFQWRTDALSILWYMFLLEWDTADNFAAQCDEVRSQVSTAPGHLIVRLAATRRWIKRSCEGLLDTALLDSEAHPFYQLTIQWGSAQRQSLEDASAWTCALTHRSVHEFVVALLANEWRDLVAGFDTASVVVHMVHAYVTLPWAVSATVKMLMLWFFDVQGRLASDSASSMHENFATALDIERAIEARGLSLPGILSIATHFAVAELCHEYIEWINKRCPRGMEDKHVFDALDNLGYSSYQPRCAPTVWQLLEGGASPMEPTFAGIPYWIHLLRSMVPRGQGGLSNLAAILAVLVRAPGPLPMWIWVEKEAVTVLGDNIYWHPKIPGWPEEVPLPGTGAGTPRTASLADFVVAMGLPNSSELLALLDEREPATVRAARAQGLVQDFESIRTQWARLLEDQWATLQRERDGYAYPERLYTSDSEDEWPVHP